VASTGMPCFAANLISRHGYLPFALTGAMISIRSESLESDVEAEHDHCLAVQPCATACSDDRRCGIHINLAMSGRTKRSPEIFPS